MYQLHLSESDRDDLHQVARVADGWGLDGETLAAMRRRLADRDALRAIGTQLSDGLRSNGAALVSNTPQSDAELVALLQVAAVPSPAGNGDALVYDVAPTADEPADLSRTNAPFPLHTDSTFLRAPHDVLGLLCLQSAPGADGESLVVRAAAVVERLGATAGEEVVEALMDPVFPFYLRDPLVGFGVQVVPIIEGSGNDVRIRYRSDIVNALAARHQLGDRQCRALEALERVLADPNAASRVRLGRGDLLLIDNRRTLHGRTAIVASQARRLRRVKGFMLQTSSYRIV